ncbi:hypothetical protein Tco_0906881 [Tanacetum coccineum]|uniref:Uncharacterized protein n=1 Tax=Tanacetum coccineum TaxID=301880 RepID=A0ABQ5CHP6_9ASTR
MGSSVGGAEGRARGGWGASWVGNQDKRGGEAGVGVDSDGVVEGGGWTRGSEWRGGRGVVVAMVGERKFVEGVMVGDGVENEEGREFRWVAGGRGSMWAVVGGRNRAGGTGSGAAG